MIFNRLITVLWLKWRLAANVFSRNGAVEKVVSILIIIGGLLSTIGAFFGAMLVGYFMTPNITTDNLLLIWDIAALAFLVGIVILVFTDLQQSETISLKNFLHLPVSPFHAFLLNFLSSCVNLMTLFVVPGLLGFSLTHWSGYGWQMLFTPLLFATYVLMVMAFAYQVRTWVSILVVNKRSQKTILAVVTLVIILLSQIPVILQMTVFPAYKESAKVERREREEEQALMRARVESGDVSEMEHGLFLSQQLREDSLRSQRKANYFRSAVRTANFVVPFGWMPLGIQQNAKGDFLVPFLCFTGMWLLTVISLKASYKTTLRFYRGDIQQRRRPADKMTQDADAHSEFGLLGKKFPFISSSQSAIVGATLTGMIRDPGTRMVLASPILLVLIITGIVLMRVGPGIDYDMRALIGLGIGALTVFGLSQLLQNQFGFDRNGFRSYVLSPISRSDILIGKNLAPLPIAIAVTMCGLIAVQFFLPMRPMHFLSAIVAFLSFYLISCIIGNFVSIMVPMAIKPGSNQPENTNLTVMAIQVVLFSILPISLLPVAAPFAVDIAGRYFLGFGPNPSSLILSLLLLGGVILFYRWITPHLAKLMQSREVKILNSVTIKGK